MNKCIKPKIKNYLHFEKILKEYSTFILLLITIILLLLTLKYKNYIHLENFISEKEITLYLKKVSTEEELKKGLMFRKTPLKDNQGMLFDFPITTIQSIWMKNTYIPLDIIFLDENLYILGFYKNAIPHSLKSIKIDTPSKYVIEMNSGDIDRLKLKINQNIKNNIKLINKLQ
jgi:uncharacterized membrane protein (UPF0127 family)